MTTSPVAAPLIRPIARPVDRVVIEIKADLTPKQYRAVSEAIRKAKGRRRKGFLLHALGIQEVEGDFNLVHMDVKKPEQSSGNRTVEVELMQDWFSKTGIKRLQSLASPGDVEVINEIVNLLGNMNMIVEMTRHVVWVFQPGEADFITPLPFVMPLPEDAEMSTVVGLRLANNDRTQTVTIDQRPNAGLSINLHFETYQSFTINALDQAIEDGYELLNKVVKVNKEI